MASSLDLEDVLAEAEAINKDAADSARIRRTRDLWCPDAISMKTNIGRKLADISDAKECRQRYMDEDSSRK
ncbi:MAG: hypothetical protein ACT4PN_08650 [Nitrospiraceae bacterium]